MRQLLLHAWRTEGGAGVGEINKELMMSRQLFFGRSMDTLFTTSKIFNGQSIAKL